MNISPLKRACTVVKNRIAVLEQNLAAHGYHLYMRRKGAALIVSGWHRGLGITRDPCVRAHADHNRVLHAAVSPTISVSLATWRPRIDSENRQRRGAIAGDDDAARDLQRQTPSIPNGVSAHQVPSTTRTAK